MCIDSYIVGPGGIDREWSSAISKGCAVWLEDEPLSPWLHQSGAEPMVQGSWSLYQHLWEALHQNKKSQGFVLRWRVMACRNQCWGVQGRHSYMHVYTVLYGGIEAQNNIMLK